MSTSEEIKEVLESIEEEYRSDLAVHLYSSILLRRIDPMFPQLNWGSWPLPANEVPDPQTSLKYVDCHVPNDAFENDIDADFEKIQREREEAYDELYIQKYGVSREERRNQNILKLKNRQEKDNEEHQNEKSNDGVQDDDEDEDEKDEDEEEEDENEEDHDNTSDDGDDDENDLEEDPDDKMLEIVDENGTKKPTKVTYTVSPSNSKADLLNEVAALIERKIAEKAPIWKKKIDEKFEVAPNISNQTIKEMSKSVAGKVDKLLNSIVAKLTTSKGVASIKTRNRILGWSHILLAGLDSIESPYDYYKPEPYAKLYNKCEEMFENIDYKYEYDEEMEEGNENDEVGNENNEALDNEDRFDVIRYLKSLPKSDTPKYQYNLKHYFEIRNRRKRYAHDLKNIYMKRLEIQKKYNELYWRARTKPLSQINTNSRRQIIKDLKVLRNNAITHGSNNIDADNYYLDDY